MEIIMLTINIVEMNVIIGLKISVVDVEVIKQIMKGMGSVDALVAIKDTNFMVMIATYLVNTSGEIIRTTLTHSNQSKTNSLEGVVWIFIALQYIAIIYLTILVLQGCIASYLYLDDAVFYIPPYRYSRMKVFNQPWICNKYIVFFLVSFYNKMQQLVHDNCIEQDSANINM